MPLDAEPPWAGHALCQDWPYGCGRCEPRSFGQLRWSCAGNAVLAGHDAEGSIAADLGLRSISLSSVSQGDYRDDPHAMEQVIELAVASLDRACREGIAIDFSNMFSPHLPLSM